MKNKKFFINLIETGIKIWLRSKCKAIKIEKLNILGSTPELLKGQIGGVNILLREVIFQDINFERVEIKSNQIDITPNIRKSGLKITFNKAFDIDSKIHISVSGLNQTINSKSWQSINDWFSRKLLNSNKLIEIDIIKNHLILYHYNQDKELIPNSFILKCNQGEIIIQSCESNLNHRFPMDPSISIRKAEIEDQKIILIVTSKVDE